MPLRKNSYSSDFFPNVFESLRQAITVIIMKEIVASPHDTGKDAISQFAVSKGSYGKMKYTQIILNTIIVNTEMIDGEREYFIPLSIASRTFMIPQMK